MMLSSWFGAMPPRHVVEPKRMARRPRDRMIGARGVSTDADGAESLACRAVDRQAAAKHVNAADQLPDHRVLSACAIPADASPISDKGIREAAAPPFRTGLVVN
jgi:hypothetical protein